MGMYTALVFAADIDGKAPEEVIRALEFMVDDDPFALLDRLPDHPLFKEGSRWQWMFNCGSYYHDGDTHSSLRYDDISKAWVLTVRCDLKNYSNEIEKFLDWIGPYVDSYDGQFHGYSHYEEYETPTLIYYNGKGGRRFEYVECNKGSRRVPYSRGTE